MEIKNKPFFIVSPFLLFMGVMAGAMANFDNGLLAGFFVLTGLFNLMTGFRRMSYNYIEADDETFVLYNDHWTTEKQEISELKKIEQEGSAIKLYFGEN